ncbi:unnamed protein product [Mytilus edulis]|uniref:Fucosyltransferase n=1 Tax=Mytilus edulis TaxID=6550 RepID=A0A8S3SWM4_MYTED|nr:unnamed protein product [Mytilus edulis]
MFFFTPELALTMVVFIVNHSYRNCKFTTDTKQLSTSTAVIFHHDSFSTLPVKASGQIWIFATLESPYHTRLSFKTDKSKMKFNWTMTYRKDSEGFSPYALLKKQLHIPFKNYTSIFLNKTHNIAWVVSHCQTQSKREAYVKELSKYIDVDIYGKCGNPCSFTEDCKVHLNQQNNQLYYTTDQQSNQLYYTTDQQSNQLYYTTVQRSNQLYYTTDQQSNQLYYTTDQRSNQLYYTTDQQSNQLYYTTDQRRKGDEVVCFSCNLPYKNWKGNDSPKEIHIRCSPLCNFIQNKSSEIISNSFFEKNTISTVSNSSQINATKSDITFTRGLQTHLSSISSNSRDSNRQAFLPKITNDVSTDTQASIEPMTLGICLDKPKYPKYAVRRQRLDSFQHWPPYLTQSPDEMALAGFFYAGSEDHCRCFSCGGSLRNWEPGDQPWVEHARWYQNCAFVRNCKGDRFIQDVQTNNMQTEIFKKANITNSALYEAILSIDYILEEDMTETILEEDMAETIVEKRVNKQKPDQELELSNRILKEENQNLKDHQTCKICLDEPIEIVFLPVLIYLLVSAVRLRLEDVLYVGQKLEGELRP